MPPTRPLDGGLHVLPAGPCALEWAGRRFHSEKGLAGGFRRLAVVIVNVSKRCG